MVKDLNTGAPLIHGLPKDGVYVWPATKPLSSPPTALSCLKLTLSDWHSRLGHPAFSVLRHIISGFDVSLSKNVSSILCDSCSINKSHKLPFSLSSLSSSRPLELLFSDVWTSPILSMDGFKYYVIFVDHFTRYSWLYPLKRKSDVRETFVRFKALVENKFSCKISMLYSDNGGEFLALSSFLATHGISHHTTPPHTPEHNGISERKHRHVVETGLSLLHRASLPLTYWPYALATATYLINRMPTSVLGMKSPFESLFNSSPNYSKLRVFGCLCYPWLKPYTTHKLAPKSTPCVFLGYSPSQSAYFCYDISSSRMYVSRHVVFHESSFPSAHRDVSPGSHSSSHLSDPSLSSPVSPVSLVVPYRSPVPRSSHGDSPCAAPSPLEHEDTSPMAPPDPVPATCAELPSDVSLDAVSSIASPSRNRHHMMTRGKNNITKPISKLTLVASVVDSNREPSCVSQALKDPRWRQAMSEEFDALVRNGTWELVPSVTASNTVGCKWVFRIKKNPDGTIDRFKARLVAKGFHQRPGIDFHETFSPVVKPTTIRVVLSLAVSRNWPIRQLDVNNAFLQGHLSDEVYMSQPPGFVDKDNPSFVCRLRKAIYGLKQAPRAWYSELRNFLLASGFVNSVADASLFVFREARAELFVLVYVDDLIVTGSCSERIQEFISALAARFSLKDLGSLSFFLGIEASRTSKGLFLSQRKYIHDLLSRTNMHDSKPVSTPMPSTSRLTSISGSPLSDPSEFRMVIGSLQYLSLTRPDISYAVNKLSQFMHAPTDVHWSAAKRVLRFLAGSSSAGIFFASANTSSLHAFSDSDWAGDPADFKSTGAYIVYLGRHPVSWSSKKLSGHSRSSTEAEYRSIANTSAELRWLSSLLVELGCSLPSPPVIYCDNIGATYLCANPVFHSRMKHLALDYHFVRSQVNEGSLRVSHVSSKDQLADALTKPLPRSSFHDLCIKIGVSSGPPSCGGV